MDATRAAAVARAFALGSPEGLPAFVARGAMGELWRLETDEGRWAVKVLFDRARPDSPVPRDVELQTAAATAGITLPRPRLAHGLAVLDGVRVYEWVDLAPELPRPVDRATAAEAGDLLGRIHGLGRRPRPGDAVDDWYLTAPSPADWDLLTDRADGAGASWARALRSRLPRLDELGRFVRHARPAERTDVLVCHRDFDPSNVFRPAAGGPLVVLDWENAGPLSAAAELAMALAAWVHPDDTRTFLDAYRVGGGTAVVAGPDSYATLVATNVNYLRVVVAQTLDDDGHRAFAEPVVEDRLRDGGDIDRILPAIEASLAAQGWTG